jgi:hypothetical protein
MRGRAFEGAAPGSRLRVDALRERGDVNLLTISVNRWTRSGRATRFPGFGVERGERSWGGRRPSTWVLDARGFGARPPSPSLVEAVLHCRRARVGGDERLIERDEDALVGQPPLDVLGGCDVSTSSTSEKPATRSHRALRIRRCRLKRPRPGRHHPGAEAPSPTIASPRGAPVSFGGATPTASPTTSRRRPAMSHRGGPLPRRGRPRHTRRRLRATDRGCRRPSRAA